jgi:polyisoprenyl-phosphate glycosyltransferase
MTHLSIVIPVFNESSLIAELVTRVRDNIKLITEDFEIIIVDDGSQDNTWNLVEIESKSESRIKGIKFSRNFGHHYAITAGLHSANGEWVVVMDGDLQDRPEVIPELYDKAMTGYDVVFVSRQNRQEKLYYRIAQKFFYWILRTFSGVDFDSRQANFSIINKKVVDAFKQFPENARFYGSVIKWLGFNSTFILANHGIRFSGNPSYTLKRRVQLASDIILSSSDRPLKLSIISGLLLSILSLIFMTVLIFHSVYYNLELDGWTSVILALLFSTGTILTVTGVSAIYIGEIFKQVKGRPLYIVEKRI